MRERQKEFVEQNLTWTSARLSLLANVFSFRIVVSSEAILTVIPTTKFLIPKHGRAARKTRRR